VGKLQLRHGSIVAALQDHIDDSGHGVGAILRRSAIDQHIDTIDTELRNDGRIDRAADFSPGG